MRAVALGLLGALGLAAGFSTADATTSGPISTPTATVAKSVPVASHKCAKGQYWVPAGYAKHGKYRAGHCAPR
jgi:hypothetical protein